MPPKSPLTRIPLNKNPFRSVLSPPGSPRHPVQLVPGSLHQGHAHAHFATSAPKGHLPTYGHVESVPGSPPAAPHPYRAPSGPYQMARTMPAQPLPNPFGSPPTETLPAYSSHAPSQTYHGDGLPSNIDTRHRNSVGSPTGITSPRSVRSRSLVAPSGPPGSASFPHPVPVNQHAHEEAVRRHHVSGHVNRFFFSSIEYVKHSYYPVHPAFARWVQKLGPEAIAIIWREVSGNILLPVVYMFEYKSKANVESYDVGARLEYLHLSQDGKSFSMEYMGDICIREEWHLVHKNKPLLMLAIPGNPRLIPVRGQMFMPKGSDKRFPTKAKANIQLLTLSFRGDKDNKSRWELTHDGVIEVAEKSGDGDRVAVVSSENSVHGYIIDGPIEWEEGTKHPEMWKNGFLTHLIMSLIIIPLNRQIHMPRLYEWLVKLGPLAVEDE